MFRDLPVPSGQYKKRVEEKMRRLLLIAVSVFFMTAIANAHAAAPLAISSQGWTIAADGEQGVVSISQQNLGVVLRNVRINLREDNAILPLTNWSVRQTSQSQLTIHTAHPMTAWNFDISHDLLKISSTATNSVLTAEAPAPLSRIP